MNKTISKMQALRSFYRFRHGIASKQFSQSSVFKILGIETSFDDTGCAIVNSTGHILGEALNSQHLIHLEHGGVIPPIAQKLHRENIETVVNDALKRANIDINDVNAIAATTKPGIPLSLVIGMKYGKHLSRKYHKPFIPIHHMEAHALTARMVDPTIDFPFLVLLISGGHCLLAIAQDVDKFLLLGQSLDDAPGEAFDKMARRLKLKNLIEFEKMSGGQAIEKAASTCTSYNQFEFGLPLARYRDCNFSFAGMKNKFLRHILRQEKEHQIQGDMIIPDYRNLCASFLVAVTKHLCHRTQRAMEFANLKRLIPPDKQTLVVSGGVACNDFIFKGLSILCDNKGYKISRPPPKLCLDNGVMIAWNGIEKWKIQRGIATDLNAVDIQAKCPLGEQVVDKVVEADIKCKWVKLKELLNK